MLVYIMIIGLYYYKMLLRHFAAIFCYNDLKIATFLKMLNYFLPTFESAHNDLKHWYGEFFKKW